MKRVLNNDLMCIVEEYVHRSSWKFVMSELIVRTEGIRALLMMYKPTEMYRFHIHICEVCGCRNWDYLFKSNIWNRCICFDHAKQITINCVYKKRKK